MATVTKKSSKARMRAPLPPDKSKPEEVINPLVLVSPEVFDSLLAEAGRKGKPNPAIRALMQRYRNTIKTVK
jgi:hypothetical protein